MAEERVQNNQQTIVIALVVVAVALVGIVGFLMYQQSQNALPAPTATSQGAVETPAGQMPPAGGAAAGGAAAPAAPVDPGKATKVDAGTTPEEWVKAYYTATEEGDFAAAVKHLPADKQANTTPESLKEQLAGYGITGFKISKASEQGDTATVVVDQTTKSFGTFENTWTFQKDGETWVVASKAVTGMK